MQSLGTEKLRKRAKRFLKARRRELASAQELLYADNRYALLLIFQARDAGGKDGTIKHVMRGVNPQGCQVWSFKSPSEEELDHNFLWRYWQRLPERGRIGIYNRSYYEEVLVVRVHPELLGTQDALAQDGDKNIWQRRFEDINAFERHLVRNGTLILKFYLNVSKEEQRRRFLDRLAEPDKHWKFSESDLTARRNWDAYTHTFEAALSATNTAWAPWYVLPADNKWITRALVGHIITKRLKDLELRYPKPDSKMKKAIQNAIMELG